ncbi:DUF3644 domain-containing protein [Daejeonella oryzae]|uniref:DUF3644 domain-containing protein n=1 Tax=Daejeonella oryzae TaxID=1122943 RepID=UPI0003FC47BC|nr:DUF3644 domain-containing protein [Daejeonella oryzae]
MAARLTWSVKEELLIKSREAMLCAVQLFNNPSIKFKAEGFIVLSNIAWTYLMHAYYRNVNIEYRYHTLLNGRKRFDRTAQGSFKFWELERCLNEALCPLDNVTIANLKFLIGLRHEIEHQMTSRIDEYLSSRFQACCLNYNKAVKDLFTQSYGIDKYLSFSLQFSTINEDHAAQLMQFDDLPRNISSYINAFDGELSEEQYNDVRYSYRVFYVPKLVNRKGQADKVIEFIPADSEGADHLNKEYVIIKDREKKKLLPTAIWQSMKEKGFVKFGPHQHTQLWKRMNAKADGKPYGIWVEKTWYWYEKWMNEVLKHCELEGDLYK